MAKIGLEYFKAAELDEDTSVSLDTLTYKNAREIGPAAKISTSLSTANVKDHGDDRMLLTDVSFTSGTVNLELNEPTKENEAWLLGHTIDDELGIVYKEDDVPPYVGLGFIGKSKKDNSGSVIYRAKVYPKVQFKDHADEYDTKTDTIAFTHTSIEGDMYCLNIDDAKSWKLEQEFTTLAEAKAYIDSILGTGSEETA